MKPLTHPITIAHGDIITVSPELFDALVKAQLLAVTGHDKSASGETWPTYGDTNDDGTVTCMLVEASR